MRLNALLSKTTLGSETSSSSSIVTNQIRASQVNRMTNCIGAGSLGALVPTNEILIADTVVSDGSAEVEVPRRSHHGRCDGVPAAVCRGR